MPFEKADPPAPKRHVTTMRLRNDLLNLVDAEAVRRDMSRTKLVEAIMARWLNSIGHKTDLEPNV